MNSTKFLIVVLGLGSLLGCGYFLLFAISSIPLGGQVVISFNEYGELYPEIIFFSLLSIGIIISVILGVKDCK